LIFWQIAFARHAGSPGLGAQRIFKIFFRFGSRDAHYQVEACLKMNNSLGGPHDFSIAACGAPSGLNPTPPINDYESLKSE
jgi:hypothetical protein